MKCMMWKDGRCNSDYGKDIICDGLDPPKNICPYNWMIKEEKDNFKVNVGK